MKERLVYISNARIIGILLVVFGHSYPLTGEIPKVLDIVRSFIYCFHMPLFVFISAYLVSKTGSIEKYGAKQYIQKRFVKLMVPYFGLSVLGFLPKILMSGFINDEVEFSFTYFIRTLLVPRENVWGHFWFIPMLFVGGGSGGIIREVYIWQYKIGNPNMHHGICFNFHTRNYQLVGN